MKEDGTEIAGVRIRVDYAGKRTPREWVFSTILSFLADVVVAETMAADTVAVAAAIIVTIAAVVTAVVTAAVTVAVDMDVTAAIAAATDTAAETTVFASVLVLALVLVTTVAKTVTPATITKIEDVPDLEHRFVPCSSHLFFHIHFLSP